jgi:hypothetical protein
MPRTLSDLQAALFAQLDRVANPDLSKEDLDAEIRRSEAVRDLADQIIGSADTQLKAAKLYGEHGGAVAPYLPLIGQSSPKLPNP